MNSDKRRTLKSLFPKPKKREKNDTDEYTKLGSENAVTSTSLVTLKPRKTEDDEIGELALEFDKKLKSMNNWFSTNINRIKRKYKQYQIQQNLNDMKDKTVEINSFTPSTSRNEDNLPNVDVRTKYSVINAEIRTIAPDNKGVKDGEYASLCISLVGTNSLLQGKTPLSVNWPSVVNRGAELYTYWKTWISKETQTVYPSLSEVLTIFSTNCSFVIGKELRGFLDDSIPAEPIHVTSLRDSISIMQREKMAVAVVNIDHYCFCVYHEQNDDNTDLWMFDSHGGNESDKSSLIRFFTGIDLFKYIRDKHLKRESQPFEFVIFLKNDQ